MLIGICGALCAGKTSIQDYLIRQHDFEPLALKPQDGSTSIATSSKNGVTAALVFATPEQLVEYATRHWQKRFVTTSIHNEAIVDLCSQRPFFLLLHVDAPISLRWQRFRRLCNDTSSSPPTLEQFVERNDRHQYDPATGLATLASRAQVKLLNSTSSLEALHLALGQLDLTDPSRLRPAWDHYFMTLAFLAARRSNCMRRQVGCVLVREKRVMSTGYNGTPRNVTNCNEGGCPRCNGAAAGGAALHTCLCIHAEENALLEAGRERVGGGAVLYCTTCPCLTCSIKIVQVGITEVVFSRAYHMDKDSSSIFTQAGVKLRQFSPPKEGLMVLGDDMMTTLTTDPLVVNGH